MHARRIGHIVRIRYIAAALLIGLLFAMLWHTPVTALQLPSATIDVPLRNTPVDHLVSPLAEQVSALTPVTITSTPQSLGVTITPPLSSPTANSSAPLISTAVDIPLVPQVTTPTAPPFPAPAQSPPPLREGTPAAEAALSSAPASPVTTASIQQPSSTPQALSSVDLADNNSSALTFTPIILGMANFLGSSLPHSATTVYTKIHDTAFAMTPLFLLIVTLAMIISVVYSADRVTVTGRGRLAQFASSHDMAQIAAASVVILGTLLIIVFVY